jgi:hypothetical protein
LSDRRVARLITVQPEAMVHMLAPDIAIEVIELIVMLRDG